jgi:undecaprenyl-diphosphatase
MANRSLKLSPGRQHLLVLFAAAIVFYLVLPQLGDFRHSWSLVKNARPPLLTAALLFTCLSYVMAAGTYYLLALKPLSYWRTLIIQLAGMFVNRLLPAGLGSISVNFLNLRRSGHSSAQAVSVVATNNSLGVAGNVLLLAALWLPLRGNLPGLSLAGVTKKIEILVAVSFIVLIFWIVFYTRYRSQMTRHIRAFVKQLSKYRYKKERLAAALLCSVGLTMSNMLSFWLCVLAMHISLPFIAVLIILSFGTALGSATPTPGGLGGVEAGLLAGLLAYQVDSTAALAAVMSYRLASYWLPLVAGALALVFSQRDGYLDIYGYKNRYKKRGAV